MNAKYTIGALLASFVIIGSVLVPFGITDKQDKADLANEPQYSSTETNTYGDMMLLSKESDSESEDYSVSAIDDYELNISEFATKAIASSKAKTISVENKYGTFTVERNNYWEPKKFTYKGSDSSGKYLIKGTAKFAKVSVTFDGYFLVDNSLSGRKKGQVTLYKGKLTLPNGDKYDGTLDSGKYYSSGTYTWKNGMSYKGKFTKNNKLGTTSLSSGSSNYGYFYFDKTKKKYLYIRFVNGVPRESGYYYENGKKYVVKYDKYGNCIYTAVAK